MARRTALTLAMAAAVATPALLGTTAGAAETTTPDLGEGFSYLATHPEAAAQPMSGQGIDALAVDGDTLVAGYGDYNANTGPVHLDPFDLTTGQFTGSQVALAGEEILVFRQLGDALYAPNIDPRTGWNSPTGYATNVNGVWEEHRKVPFVHVYDMAERVPGEYWMVGSANTLDGSAFGGATAYRSTDAGQTWDFVRQDTDKNEADRNGFERYYWIGAAGGKVIMQAASVVDAPVQVFDGQSWSTVNRLPKDWMGGWSSSDGVRLCSGDYTPATIGSLGDDLMVCNGHSQAWTDEGATVTFDGSTLTQHIGGWAGGRIYHAGNSYSYARVTDWFEGDDGWLYALVPNKGIARTQDGATFQVLHTGSVPAASIAVHDGRVYLGDHEANLHVSDLTVEEMVAADGEVVSPTRTLSTRVGGGKPGGGGGKDKPGGGGPDKGDDHPSNGKGNGKDKPGGGGPDKGDDHPSNGKGNGKE